MKNEIIKISEVFKSIQGEGVNLGTPSLFIRLASCNLSCKWCDTKYSWDWENHDKNKEVKEFPLKRLSEKIEKTACKNIVITGGEPLLQQKQLYILLNKLKSNLHIEVETSGTILPSKFLLSRINNWNVSPKLSSSGNRKEVRYKSEVLNFFASLNNSWFKFVVENKEDINEAIKIVNELLLPKEKVILMPQAKNNNELVERSKFVVDYCTAHGFRFGTRLHISIWGDERGV
jgi:organic radical activating enzyme